MIIEENNIINYENFLKTKIKQSIESGFLIPDEWLNPYLMSFQKDIVKWAVRKGKSCIFADCGLGKTIMQLNWAEAITKKTNAPVLILAPLAVTEQTKLEGDKFGIPVNIAKSQEEIKDGINITNYEKLDKFNPDEFAGIVLDESSILKSFTGKTRTKLIDAFRKTPYKLCCTATPAPNDYMELGNHCEFIDVMSRNEMLSMFFTHDGSNTSKWNLKGHASSSFWQWLASWAIVVSNPNDLGYLIEGFTLPELNMNEVIVDGGSFISQTQTLRQRQEARRKTIVDRCNKAVEIAEEIIKTGNQCLVWCDLNKESELINKGLGDHSNEIKGTTKEEKRLESILNFTNGKLPVLVTKPSIAGFGMNWQNCHNMIFVGLSDSYEKFYQAIRRCWRFGQENEVNVYIIISSKEGAVLENIKRKELDSNKMRDEMRNFITDSVKDELKLIESVNRDYHPNTNMILPRWEEFYIASA